MWQFAARVGGDLWSAGATKPRGAQAGQLAADGRRRAIGRSIGLGRGGGVVPGPGWRRCSPLRRSPPSALVAARTAGDLVRPVATRARTSLGSLACGPPHGFGGCRRRSRCTDDRRRRPVQRNERHIGGASTQVIGCASWDGRDQNAAADRTGRGREGRLERATGFPPAMPAWPVTALVSRSDGSRSRAARTQAASRASGLPLAGTDASRSDCVRTRPPGSAAPCPCRSRARPHRP
jgi:hypothetical protein